MADNKNKHDDDPGYTIANMDVDGIKGHNDRKFDRDRSRINGMRISRSERRAMIKGAYAALLPSLLFVVVGFLVAIGLLYLFYFINK